MLECQSNSCEEVKRLEAELSSLKSAFQRVEEMNRLLQAQLFGRKSEKRVSAPETSQLLLFPSPEVELPPPVDHTEEITYERKKPGRKKLPKDLPRIDIMYDIPEEDKVCECGCQKTRIGEETSEKIDYIPATLQILNIIRPKYACKGCEGVESSSPAVMIAPPPKSLVSKSNASVGLLAHVFTAKFADALPFYRLEKIFARQGIHISRSSMSNWAIKAAEKCTPLIAAMHDLMLEGPLIQCDETPLQVLKEPGREDTKKSYMWLFRGGPPDKPALIYCYHPTRAGKVAKDFLRQYKGYVQTDGYAGYDFLDGRKGVYHMACWAHARRKFFEASKAAKAASNDNSSSSYADVAIQKIALLYKVEKYIKKSQMDHEQGLQYRQENAKPVLDDLKKWLLDISALTPPKGLLGKAVHYTLKQWPRLCIYAQTSHVPPDNNLAENAIRPFVVGRKNWLFSGSPSGAKASAIFFSLIETAKANNIEPFAYLKYIFTVLPHVKTKSEYRKLLPSFADPGRIASCKDRVVQ